MKDSALNPSSTASLWLLVLLVSLSSLSSVAMPSTGYCQESVQPPQTEGVAEDDDLGGLLEGLDLGSDDGTIPTIPDASKNVKTPGSQDPDSNGQSSAAENGSSSNGFAGLAEAFESMRKAGQLLSAGQTDETVLDAQQRAVDLLDSLIKAREQADRQNASQQSQSTEQQAANQQGERQQQSSGPENQPTTAANDADQEEDAGDQSSEAEGNNAGASDNETEADRGGTAPVSAAGLASPLNAAGQGVWGHLPQKTRGMLRAEIPTDYLPRYSQQISDYFRALAEMSSEQ